VAFAGSEELVAAMEDRLGRRLPQLHLAADSYAETDAGKAVIAGLYLIGTGLRWEYANPTYDDLFPTAPLRSPQRGL
jgi:hypothetical protein